MGVLAQQVSLASGGITKLLDRMIEAGLVQRVPCPTDRRVAFAALTAKGQGVLRQAKWVHARDLRQVFTGFSDDDLRTLDRPAGRRADSSGRLTTSAPVLSGWGETAPARRRARLRGARGTAG